MGPSGSGKSTLMHCLAGLDSLTSGRRVHRRHVPRRAQRQGSSPSCAATQVGFIFQAYNLVPTLNADENITLPLLLGGDDGDQAWIDQVIDTVGSRATG